MIRRSPGRGAGSLKNPGNPAHSLPLGCPETADPAGFLPSERGAHIAFGSKDAVEASTHKTHPDLMWRTFCREKTDHLIGARHPWVDGSLDFRYGGRHAPSS